MKAPTQNVYSVMEFIRMYVEVNMEHSYNIDMSEPCTIHVYARNINGLYGGGIHFQPSLVTCIVCGRLCYPTCASHYIEQWSRLTGFVAVVSGFNVGIEQELKDRRMY